MFRHKNSKRSCLGRGAQNLCSEKNFPRELITSQKAGTTIFNTLSVINIQLFGG
jgi:hypothetical protein